MDHKKAVKLEDSELEMVTGGTGLQAAPIGVITVTTCDNFLCCWCRGGKKAGQSGHYCEAQGGEASLIPGLITLANGVTICIPVPMLTEPPQPLRMHGKQALHR